MLPALSLGPAQLRRIALAVPLLTLVLMALHLWRLEAAHDRLQQDTLSHARAHAAQLADAKASQVEALILGADMALRQFRASLLAGPREAVDGTAQAALAAFPAGAVAHFAASDAAGELVYSSFLIPGLVNVADREYFRQHAASTGDELLLSPPQESRVVNGRWLLQLTRPVLRQGRFDGIVAMSLSPHYLSQLLAQLQVAPDDAIALVFTDGTYAARHKDIDKALGRRVPTDRPFLGGGVPLQGSVRTAAHFDGRVRLYGWQRLRNLPLVMVVGLDEATLLAPVVEDARLARVRNALALPLVLMMALGLAYLLLRNARRQDELGRSRALLQATLEATADGLLVTGPDGRLLELNRRFKAMWRVPDGMAEPGLPLAADAPLVRHVMEQLVDGPAFVRRCVDIHGSDVATADEWHCRDGRIFERYTQPVQLNGHGARLWSFRDVTERERIQQALRQSDQRFRTLFDASPEALFLLDGLAVVDCNPAAERLVGVPRDRLLGHSPVDLSPPEQPDGEDSRGKAGRLVETACREGSVRFEWLHRRVDGTSFHGEVTLRPIDLLGRRLMYAAMRDVSERKLAEAALVRSEARSRAVFDGARDGIAVADAQTLRLVDVNPALCAMLGHSREHLLTLTVHDMHPPEHLPAVLAIFDRQLRSEINLAPDLPVRHCDGRVLYMDVSAAPLQLDGRAHLAGFFRDVTERRAVQAELQRYRENLELLVDERTQQLREAKAAAEAASVAKSAFLANMSHEIRTPLNAITGMVHLLKLAGLTPQQADRVAKIDAAGAHLLDIINAVLDLSKIEAGRFVLDEAPVDVGQVVRRVATMLLDRTQARRLALVTEVQPMPSGLLGDATRLQQALLNYAGNAVKFTPAGKIVLRAAVQEQTAHDVCVRFEVQDSGVGVAPDKLPRLFSAFEQGDNSTTRQYGGTGLGLAITQRLAQLMGGAAGADSTLGQGSTFWFTARLRRGPVPLPERRPAHAQPGTADGEDAVAALAREHAGARVLLAEDEPVNREITATLLQSAGVQVDLAPDGAQAVQRVEQGRYDLVLMDMQMPHMDGLQATRCIRALPGGAAVPILALTANAFEEDRSNCLEAGMNDFVAKPIEPGRLFAVVLRWLRATRGAPAAGRSTP